MGKVITIKNNKGGVGKSWITLQLAHVLSMIEKSPGKNHKILTLTSDSQNNILLYAGIDLEITTGLEDLVIKGTGDIIRLRDNLYYIPLVTNNFSKNFREKLKTTLEQLKNEYDFILVDSVPVLNIDEDFVKLADYIIIPTILDTASCKGILNLSNEVDIKKIKAIIPNKYTKTKAENFWKNILNDFLKGNSIYFSRPINQSAIIGEMTHNGKTIWESSSKKVEEFQEILLDVAQVIVNEK
ncbi:MAG: ParA family protein [Cetobacterium sp.]|uniref:ParA family protein n=1 Tax=unclassified Cetobacterium TaxID=2630983 RepID=UPI00163CC4A3|nr:ParA family protein [Cetobacterium sp. 2A]MBC2856887.1 ParA family protein [Cetobacterium sp. 2A]